MIPEHRPNLSAISGPLEDLTEAGRRSRTKSSTEAWFEPRDCDPAAALPGDPLPATPEVPAKPIDQIPAKLRALRRWTRHDHQRPITTNGEPAWVMDPPTWTTYARAKASSTGDGLGFVLDGDGIVSLDLSHCVIDGVPTPGAQAILDLLPDTYAELSLSGHGIHVFCYADVASGSRFDSHGVTIQVCGTGRFLTVTGNRLPGRPSVLAEHDAVVQALLLGHL